MPYMAWNAINTSTVEKHASTPSPPPAEVEQSIPYTHSPRRPMSRIPSPAQLRRWTELFPKYLTGNIPLRSAQATHSEEIAPDETSLQEDFCKLVLWVENALFSQHQRTSNLASLVASLKHNLAWSARKASNAKSSNASLLGLAQDPVITNQQLSPQKKEYEVAASKVPAQSSDAAISEAIVAKQEKPLHILEDELADIATHVRDVAQLNLKITYLKSFLPDCAFTGKIDPSIASKALVGSEIQFKCSPTTTRDNPTTILPAERTRTRLPSSASSSRRIVQSHPTTKLDKLLMAPRSLKRRYDGKDDRMTSKSSKRCCIQTARAVSAASDSSDKLLSCNSISVAGLHEPVNPQYISIASHSKRVPEFRGTSIVEGLPSLDTSSCTSLPVVHVTASSSVREKPIRRRYRKNRGKGPRNADGVRLTKKGIPDGRVNNYKNLAGYYERKRKKIEVKQEPVIGETE